MTKFDFDQVNNSKQPETPETNELALRPTTTRDPQERVETTEESRF